MFAASKTASVSGGYQISRSLRFNSADSAYLNRTPASASNQKTWTFSAWVKRAAISTTEVTVFGKADTYISINSNSLTVNFANGGANYFMQATAVLRDPSAWYHIIIVLDTTQATAANRASMYVNGVQTTAFQLSTYTNMAQNYDAAVNSAAAHAIGRYSGASPSAYFDGYMTEVNFIDGQALTASSFGETNAQTGVWQPKAYSGSYGTNGFYLNFSDNSNTTAATLGKDYSGNGNNWTPNNFSVTAGAGNDSLVDSPTSYGTDTGVGGTVRGNYCTLNPLRLASGVTLSNGNLEVTTNNTSVGATGTIAVTSGKWYWETTYLTRQTGNYLFVGIVDSNTSTTFPAGTNGFGYYGSGNSYGNGSDKTYGATFTVGDIIGVALDLDSGKIWWSKNGTWQASGDPVAGTNAAYTTNIAGRSWMPSLATAAETTSAALNCGQRPFAYTAPSGFKALCTQNLPTPTIGATTATQANQFFTPVIYTGDGTNNRTISAGMTPDWTWIKERGRAGSHFEFDTLRGTGVYLSTNGTGGDNYAGSLGWTNSGPTTGGFKVDVGTNDGINYNTGTYVAWNWKANGSGSTNTAGSITSTVSANTTSGFSVVTYTGVTPWPQTIGHGLGVAPSMIIIKNRSRTATGWAVYHSSVGNTKGLLLNTTDAAITDSGFWNNTTPTSSVFTTGNGYGYYVNAATDNYVAYCFAEVAGYSKFGSYTGNGSTNFIYTGFRPAYVLIRRTNIAAGWGIIDSARNAYNSANKYLNANASDAEGVGTAGSQYVDLLSNGFKCLDSSAGFNASGDTYIYMAFAESPFKYSLAR